MTNTVYQVGPPSESPALARALRSRSTVERPAEAARTLERRPADRTSPDSRLSTLLRTIESEYREMPGLKLTDAQARRLWNLDRETCERVLAALVERRVLKRTPDGHYVRAAG